VGNAAKSGEGKWKKSVHPHARGERELTIHGITVSAGSSPRSWGTLEEAKTGTLAQRFIPTLVGNASADRPESGISDGSSPRSWGTQPRLRRAAHQRWFIPTLVGNARTRAWHSVSETVHPHARGERAAKRRSPFCVTGSSPRSWGTLIVRGVHRIRLRFIPTLVGNAAGHDLGCTRCAVHPHARGERPLRLLAPRQTVGSSPRSWGTLVPMLRIPLVQRFIPTLVGNATRKAVPPVRRSVHPHARGERSVAGSRTT